MRIQKDRDTKCKQTIRQKFLAPKMDTTKKLQ